jgi:DNA-binding LytR/AlgR family response regulator
VKIFADDIIYIEGLKDYVKLHLKSQEKPVMTRLNMKGILEKLPEPYFCRVHNSFIVALDQIQSFQKNQITLQNIQIPVGLRFLEGFMEKVRG